MFEPLTEFPTQLSTPTALRLPYSAQTGEQCVLVLAIGVPDPSFFLITQMRRRVEPLAQAT